jgi:hypothetical protein
MTTATATTNDTYDILRVDVNRAAQMRLERSQLCARDGAAR